MSVFCDNDKLTYFKAIHSNITKAEIWFNDGNKQGTTKELLNLVNLAIKVPDLYAMKLCYMTIGLSSELFKEYDDAVHFYQKFRDASETARDYLSWCFAYYKLAKIYMIQMQYKYGLRCFKLMLQYSWICNNIDYEIKSYEGIAKWYFYLKELRKSKFYHDRSLRGNTEPESSVIRKYVTKRYVNKFYTPLL